MVTGDEVGEAPEIVTGSSRPEAGTWRRPLLARDRVRYVGEPVAAVVASSRYAAEDACDLIEVDYEPLDAVVDPEQALTADAPLLHEHSNNFAHIEFEHGDVDDAFACAARVVAKRFHFGRTHAAPLEGRGGIADWSRDLTFWSSTQMPFLVRSMLAGLYGLPETQRARARPGRRRGIRAQGAPLRRGGDPPVPLAARGRSRQVGRGPLRAPRGERPLEGGRLRPRARTRRGRCVPRPPWAAGRRRRRASRAPVDEPDRPALCGVDAARHLLDPGRSLRGRRRRDEQVPESPPTGASAGRPATPPARH